MGACGRTGKSWVVASRHLVAVGSNHARLTRNSDVMRLSNGCRPSANESEYTTVLQMFGVNLWLLDFSRNREDAHPSKPDVSNTIFPLAQISPAGPLGSESRKFQVRRSYGETPELRLCALHTSRVRPPGMGPSSALTHG